MTKPRPSKNALIKAVRGPSDAEVEQAYATVLRALKARAIVVGTRVTDDLTETVSPTEVRQMARQIHLERGGDPLSKPTPEDIAEAINALKAIQAEIIYQGATSARDTIHSAHLRLLAPLLKPKELAEGRITFARAVALTIGHHGHSKDYRKPSRWINDFNNRFIRAGKPNPYSGMTAQDCLTLKDFARMHYLNYAFFKLGREQVGKLHFGDTSSKKVLASGSGHAARKHPKRAEKNGHKFPKSGHA